VLAAGGEEALALGLALARQGGFRRLHGGGPRGNEQDLIRIEQILHKAMSRPPGTCFFQHPKRLSWRHNRRLLDKFSALTHYDYWTIAQAIGWTSAIKSIVVMKDK
jgi:hypothetical protein